MQQNLLCLRNIVLWLLECKREKWERDTKIDREEEREGVRDRESRWELRMHATRDENRIVECCASNKTNRSLVRLCYILVFCVCFYFACCILRLALAHTARVLWAGSARTNDRTLSKREVTIATTDEHKREIERKKKYIYSLKCYIYKIYVF